VSMKPSDQSDQTFAEVRVVLVDDHPIVRDGIRNLLAASEGIHLVGETGSGEEALSLVRQLQPDVLLLDIELEDLKGIEVARQLAAEGSPVRVLALSSYDDSEYISELLAIGTFGYLIKDEAPDSIVEAIRGVMKGEKGWVSRKVAAKLGQIIQGEAKSAALLTDRERQVLRLVVDGKTNAEIAYALEISEKTVEKHLEGIYTKLEVASRVEAAVLAVRQGLV
jgi:DNA-binding NarL/FixJ family response regulator